MSSSSTKPRPARPMPLRYDTSTRVPNVGGCSISSWPSSTTWLTASAMIPITTGSPSSETSTITTQVRFVTALAGKPKRTARSTTGTTRPRRLITPRM